MTADNVKTAFRLPIGLTKTLSRIYYDSTTNNNSIKKIISTKNNKISNNSHEKVFRNIHRKRPVLKSLFNKVSGLQPAALSKSRLRGRYFPVKVLRTRFFIKHLWKTASGRAQDFTKNSPNTGANPEISKRGGALCQPP